MARRTEPAPPSLAERPSFLLSQIGAHTAARFAALLEPYGLTPRHFAVINALVANRGLSQQQLGDLLDIHRNSMVAVLDDLERDGFVERRPSSVDRRVNSLHPTKAGIAAVARAHRVLEELENELLRGLNTAKRKELTGLLTDIIRANDLRSSVHPSLRT